MKLLIEELAEYLTNQSLALYTPDGTNGDTFLNIYPDKPDESIYIRNTMGLDSDPRFKLDILGVQIICRGKMNLATQKKAKTIFNVLDGYADKPFVTGGLHVVSCLGSNSGPVPLGKDNQGRYEFSMNFLVECERSV